MSNSEKYTLITNMTYVKYNDLNLECQALLITEGKSIRGFGSEASDEVFYGEGIEYKDKPFSVCIAEKNEYDDYCYKLSFLGGPEFRIVTSRYNNDNHLDIEKFEGDICQVWRRLPLKVAKYHSGSHISVCRWLPIESMWLSASELAFNEKVNPLSCIEDINQLQNIKGDEEKLQNYANVLAKHLGINDKTIVVSDIGINESPFCQLRYRVVGWSVAGIDTLNIKGRRILKDGGEGDIKNLGRRWAIYNENSPSLAPEWNNGEKF